MDLNRSIKNLETLENNLEDTKQRDLWKYNYVGENLNSILSSLTKNHLEDIKDTLFIPLKSNLRKEALLQGIKSSIYIFLKFYILNLNSHQFNYITNLIENDGILLYSPEDEKLVIQLRSSGIAFPVKKEGIQVVMMPSDTIDFFKQESDSNLIERINLNSEIIKVTYGLLHYYGIISYNTLWKIMTLYYPKLNIQFSKLKSIINIDINFNTRIALIYDFIFIPNINTNALFNLRTEYKSTYLEYYPINKTKALQASDPSYIDETPELINLINYFRNYYEISDNNLKNHMKQFLFLIKSGQDFTKCMNFIYRHYEIPEEEAQVVIPLIQKLYNNTRMWSLKGHTPNESSNLNSVKAPIIQEEKINNLSKSTKEIGRNDPCPCGSGKKYKKCCL